MKKNSLYRNGEDLNDCIVSLVSLRQKIEGKTDLNDEEIKTLIEITAKFILLMDTIKNITELSYKFIPALKNSKYN